MTNSLGCSRDFGQIDQIFPTVATQVKSTSNLNEECKSVIKLRGGIKLASTAKQRENRCWLIFWQAAKCCNSVLLCCDWILFLHLWTWHHSSAQRLLFSPACLSLARQWGAESWKACDITDPDTQIHHCRKSGQDPRWLLCCCILSGT